MKMGGSPAVDKEIAMKHPNFVFPLALLLSGAFCAPAMAQDARYAYPDPLYANGDADYDGIPNASDPVDDRFDEAGNPVRFEVGETLPPESYGNGTEVAASEYRLRAAGAGQAWHRLGNNAYLVDLASGRVVDALYRIDRRK
jgi:Ni/Co efflux regulator RcnB